MELELYIENVSKEAIKVFCERTIHGALSDETWRDYQLNSILTNTTSSNKNGYKIHEDSSTTYIFNMAYGCNECYDNNTWHTAIKDISHSINKIHIGENIKVSIKILDTTNGKIIKSIIESGYNIKILPISFVSNTVKKIFRLDIQ